ncbi:hypothetical protein [Echinicola rosea]|uniref:Uncharacterized protein n=1 Tax=Echinicola rosea TaxID=1807691 RepID=A0ABQ1URN7_9BACT|nr:hypothetical protein [Echinicola rosea]GGF24285.1 hypothetical protein GCM10011339_10480 [Echinicola rosea]
MDIGSSFRFLVCLDFLYTACPNKKEILKYTVLNAKNETFKRGARFGLGLMANWMMNR